MQSSTSTKIKLFVMDDADISVFIFLIRLRDIGILTSFWIFYHTLYQGIYTWYILILIFNIIVIYYLNYLKQDILIGKTCGSKILSTIKNL